MKDIEYKTENSEQFYWINFYHICSIESDARVRNAKEEPHIRFDNLKQKSNRMYSDCYIIHYEEETSIIFLEL